MVSPDGASLYSRHKLATFTMQHSIRGDRFTTFFTKKFRKFNKCVKKWGNVSDFIIIILLGDFVFPLLDLVLCRCADRSTSPQQHQMITEQQKRRVRLAQVQGRRSQPQSGKGGGKEPMMLVRFCIYFFPDQTTWAAHFFGHFRQLLHLYSMYPLETFQHMVCKERMPG